jgi:hypothetical protein
VELLSFLVGVVLFSWLISIPSRRHEKLTGKKLGRGIAGAGLHTINELFQPSQANASQVIEEQREARVAKPAPGDKDLDSLITEHVSRTHKGQH